LVSDINEKYCESNQILSPDSVIDKIMYIFQNGVATINTIDIDTMIKQTTSDSTTTLKDITMETANRLESFVVT
jgi:uncharacterized membrane protein (Fun14 family)